VKGKNRIYWSIGMLTVSLSSFVAWLIGGSEAISFELVVSQIVVTFLYVIFALIILMKEVKEDG